MENNYGKVLIICKSHPFNAIAGALTSGMFLGLLILAKKIEIIASSANIIFWILSLLTAFVLFHCIRILIKPLKMAEVTSTGIVFYYLNNAKLKSAIFIPWNNINSLKLVNRTISTGEGTTSVKRVEAKLVSASPTIPRSMFRSDAQTIDLDTNPMKPAGKELLSLIGMLSNSGTLQLTTKIEP